MIKSYKELTIDKYIELQSIDWLNMDEIDIQSNIIAILNDVDVETILDLSITEYKKLASNLSFLLEQPKVKGKKINKLKINNKEYYVIDKVEDMSAGQYIDYQSYITKNDVKMLPYVLSCLIIPKGEKYGDSYTIDDLKNLSVEEGLTIANFFLKKSRTLIRGILFYLERTMKKKMKKTKNETMKKSLTEAIQRIVLLKSFLKNGDGFLQ